MSTQIKNLIDDIMMAKHFKQSNNIKNAYFLMQERIEKLFFGLPSKQLQHKQDLILINEVNAVTVLILFTVYTKYALKACIYKRVIDIVKQSFKIIELISCRFPALHSLCQLTCFRILMYCCQIRYWQSAYKKSGTLTLYADLMLSKLKLQNHPYQAKVMIWQSNIQRVNTNYKKAENLLMQAQVIIQNINKIKSQFNDWYKENKESKLEKYFNAQQEQNKSLDKIQSQLQQESEQYSLTYEFQTEDSLMTFLIQHFFKIQDISISKLSLLQSEYLFYYSRLLIDQEKLEQVEYNYQQCYKIRKQYLPEQHIKIAQCLSQNAKLNILKQNYKLAEELQIQSYQMKLKIIGLHHHEMLDTINELGRIDLQNKNYNQAIIKFKQVYQLADEIFNATTQYQLLSDNNIGCTYFQMSDYENAVFYLEQAIEGYQQIFSKKEVKLIQSYFKLATCYLNLKKNKAAYYYMQKVINIQIQSYGKNHPNTNKYIDFLKNIEFED